MIDPKRMERIWAACPELRPEGLEFADCVDGPGVWSLDLDGMELIDDEDSESRNSEPKSIGAELCSMIPPQSAAALIRDKCVWWLAHRDGAEIYLFDEDQGEDHRKTHLSTNLTWGPRGDEEKVFINVNDPTEACLLACERVLGLEPWEPANG